MVAFRKAARTRARLRLALVGPAGSGKTYSALLLAKGLGGKVALIDSERGSGELYADKFTYDTLQIEPPYTPQKYIAAIKAAEAEGYAVVIIDSLSHAWAGEGGILEIHDAATRGSRAQNSFNTWRDVTPQHDKLVNAVLGAKTHVIATMRTKTAYEIVDDGRGKKAPQRVGLAPVQRPGVEYEFTCVLDMSVADHYATASKDRTGLFAVGTAFLIEHETGEHLAAWLDSGAPMIESPEVPEPPDPLADWKEALTQAATPSQLAELWFAMTEEQRGLLLEFKNAQKLRLGMAA